MPGQSSLDPYVILASLGIADADQAQPLEGGKDTAIWRVRWQGQPYALRVFRPEQGPTCAREVSAMRAAAAGGIPVPEVVRQGMWQERPALLLSWAPGRTLGEQLMNQPRLIWSLGRAFGRMQAAIHALPAPPEADPTAWIEWAGDEPALKARLYELPSRRTALLHLDYHPLNVMASGDQISGVLDWANAHPGDPRACFARTYTILRVEPYSLDGDSLKIAAARRLLERFWRVGYLAGGGRLDDMALFYAWAGAAMLQDMAARVRNPDSWLQDHHLDPVRAWHDAWKRRAGLPV